MTLLMQCAFVNMLIWMRNGEFQFDFVFVIRTCVNNRRFVVDLHIGTAFLPTAVVFICVQHMHRMVYFKDNIKNEYNLHSHPYALFTTKRIDKSANDFQFHIVLQMLCFVLLCVFAFVWESITFSFYITHTLTNAYVFTNSKRIILFPACKRLILFMCKCANGSQLCGMWILYGRNNKICVCVSL